MHAEVYVGDPRDGSGCAESTGRRRPIAMPGKSIIWFNTGKRYRERLERKRETERAKRHRLWRVGMHGAWFLVPGRGVVATSTWLWRPFDFYFLFFKKLLLLSLYL
eukprot:scaffold26181_cov135-Isochrysis_galbana.AAC.1